MIIWCQLHCILNKNLIFMNYLLIFHVNVLVNVDNIFLHWFYTGVHLLLTLIILNLILKFILILNFFPWFIWFNFIFAQHPISCNLLSNKVWVFWLFLQEIIIVLIRLLIIVTTLQDLLYNLIGKYYKHD